MRDHYHMNSAIFPTSTSRYILIFAVQALELQIMFPLSIIFVLPVSVVKFCMFLSLFVICNPYGVLYVLSIYPYCSLLEMSFSSLLSFSLVRLLLVFDEILQFIYEPLQHVQSFFNMKHFSKGL